MDNVKLNKLGWQQNTVDAINWLLKFRSLARSLVKLCPSTCMPLHYPLKAHALHWCFVALGLQHRKVHTTFTSK